MNDYTEHNFINNIQEKNNIVQIYLLGGVRVPGKIVGSDEYTITVESRHYTQIIYKHAITTISEYKDKSGDKNDIHRDNSNPKQAK